MSQNSSSSQKDQSLPSYSQEVGEPKSSSQKSHDSGLSQENGEMSPNQAVLTQAYKSQESASQQRSQVTLESSQPKSQASSVATQSQANEAIQGLVSTVAEHVETTAKLELELEAGSQTTSQTEKPTQ